MAIAMTVCGLHAIPGEEWQSWQTGLYHQEVVNPANGQDPDHTVAIEFTQTMVKAEAIIRGVFDVSFLTAAVHPGHIERCPGLDFADLEVEVDSRIPRAVYTVCGIYLNGQTYCGVWESHGPRAAYYDAWQEVQSEGETLMLACVHEGVVARYEPLPFAEPTATSEESMHYVMRELGVTRF